MALNWSLLGPGFSALESLQYAGEVADRQFRQQQFQAQAAQQQRTAQRQEQQFTREQQQQAAEMVGRIALNAETPEQWAAGLAQAEQMGAGDLSAYKADYTPARRAAIIAATGVAPKPAEAPSIVRTLEAAGIDPRSEQGRGIIVNNLSAPKYIPNGDGSFTMIGGAGGAPQGGGPQPGAVEDGYRFKGGNPADPSAWEPVGGAGASPRNFP